MEGFRIGEFERPLCLSKEPYLGRGRMRMVPQLLRLPSTSCWRLPHQGDIAMIRHSLWRVLRYVLLSSIATGAEWKYLDNYPSLHPTSHPPSTTTHTKFKIKTFQPIPARIHHCTYLMDGDSFFFFSRRERAPHTVAIY